MRKLINFINFLVGSIIGCFSFFILFIISFSRHIKRSFSYYIDFFKEKTFFLKRAIGLCLVYSIAFLLYNYGPVWKNFKDLMSILFPFRKPPISWENFKKSLYYWYNKIMKYRVARYIIKKLYKIFLLAKRFFFSPSFLALISFYGGVRFMFMLLDQADTFNEIILCPFLLIIYALIEHVFNFIGNSFFEYSLFWFFFSMFANYIGGLIISFITICLQISDFFFLFLGLMKFYLIMCVGKTYLLYNFINMKFWSTPSVIILHYIFITYGFFIFFFLFTFFVFWISKLRVVTYFLFLLSLLISVFMLCIYNYSVLWYQLILKLYALKMLQISYIIGIDNISIYFVILCAFLVTICYLMYWFLTYNIRLYSVCLVLTLFLLVNVFIVLDFFLLFIFFEGIIIPMVFLINFWGSRFRKIHASNLLILFTLCGSIFMLIGLLTIYSSKGSSSFFYFWHIFLFNDKQLILWLLLFIGFAVKIPVIPLHIWLPEAHVEAPTPGSVILAGVLLKLGTYAMARLLLSFINVVIDDILCFVWILASLGFNLASIIALNQQDMKKIIAYSSIAHINFSLFGFFGDNILGLSGMFFFMLGHAVTSSALFIGIGILYDRYKTRYLFYYGGLALLMPIFASLYFICILSNFAFPGTFNFVGEILVITSIFKNSNFILVLSIFPMVLSLIYSLFFFSRVFFGTLSSWFIRYYCDCIRLEFVIFVSFVFFVLLFGISPMLLKTLLFF